jgi:hypothetical protein
MSHAGRSQVHGAEAKANGVRAGPQARRPKSPGERRHAEPQADARSERVEPPAEAGCALSGPQGVDHDQGRKPLGDDPGPARDRLHDRGRRAQGDEHEAEEEVVDDQTEDGAQPAVEAVAQGPPAEVEGDRGQQGEQPVDPGQNEQLGRPTRP